MQQAIFCEHARALRDLRAQNAPYTIKNLWRLLADNSRFRRHRGRLRLRCAFGFAGARLEVSLATPTGILIRTDAGKRYAKASDQRSGHDYPSATLRDAIGAARL